MPRTYVDNASNRRLGRVGMPVGSMVVSRGSSGGGGGSYGSSSSSSSCRTYVDNSYNRSLGRVGMAHGTAVASRSGSGSSSVSGYGMPKTYVDNASNRSLGRVGMPVGSAPVSRGSSGVGTCYGSSRSSGSSRTYVDNAHNRSLGRVGMAHGTAVESRSGSSGSSVSGYGMPKTYVDNASNRSLGRVGMPVGSAPVSRGSSGVGASYQGYGSSRSSGSSRTYVDNAHNRSLGRVGMPHGTAVESRSGSSSSSGYSSQRTYVDNASNRRLGRAGMPVGSAPVSRDSSGSSSSSTKTYVDNPMNRSLGRVGKEHGTAVVSKSGTSGHSNQKSTRSPSSSSSTGKVYKDNAMNRRLGRVGKPLGSMPHSRSSNRSNNSSPGVYVDNSLNRALGRVGEPRGSMPVSKKSKQTADVRDCFQWLRDHPEEDLEMMETDNDEHTAEIVMDLINRMNQVEIWQEENGSKAQPKTTTELLDRYEGTTIQFDEIDLQEKIGQGGFGDVYFAKWEGSVVAVKKLRVQRVSQKRLRDFTAELLVFCELNHENIVKFLGACVVKPNLAIVMEYMQCSLHEAIHVDERDFSGFERLSIIEQVLCGLRYLHHEQIAHCDMKSHNVLLDLADAPVAKLTDFGLSMMRVESESSVSGVECVRNIGTPRYSAPEVLRGELLGREAMMKADMYSVSLVVFEIICEEEPFPNLNYRQLCKHVGDRTLTPDFPSGMQISAPLRCDMEACWSRHADERPTAASFLSTVESLPSLLEE